MWGILVIDQGELERLLSPSGCIVDASLIALNLIIVKIGEKDILVLADTIVFQ